MLSASRGQKAWQYWQEQLAGELPILELPTDKPRPIVQTYQGQSYLLKLDDALIQKLKNIAIISGTTLYKLLLTAFDIQIYHYTHQKDILIASPMRGRVKEDFQKIVGYFANLIPLRISLSENIIFTDLLAQVNQTVKNAQKYQDYPFSLLVDKLEPHRDPSFAPLCQVGLSWQRQYWCEQKRDSLYSQEKVLQMQPYLLGHQRGADLDLNLMVMEAEGVLQICWQYNTSLFNPDTITRAADLFVTLLEAIVANPQKTVGELPLLTKAERHQILVEWNNKSEYPKDQCIHQLFEKQVEITPDGFAVVFKEKQLTYNVIVCLDRDWEGIEQQIPENLDASINPENLADVIYTSGSTGQPKGVLVEHKNVIRLFAATQSWYNFNQNDVWTNFHSIAFDFSVWEIWGALIYGGRLVIVPYWVSRDTQTFYDLLCSEKVTVLNQTPSAFRQLISVEESEKPQSKLSLRRVIFGGEALEIQSLKPWFEQHREESPQLVNMYGITETTVHVTYRPLTINDLNSSGSVIGRPIPDLEMYILNDNLQPVPIGVPGEIYIGGDGLARGYLNRPELTQEKFIVHPFQTGKRLYKTGDLARYLPDGNIEFLGRIDNQVKIRGFRIELGEIEAVLNSNPQVQQAVVLVREDIADNKRLVAYVITNDEYVNNNQLREDLKQKLPEYMVPSAFVFLETLPLTPNGKIDRKALPIPDIDLSQENQLILPRDTIEIKLAQIWSKVLNIYPIGVTNNFFELGGDSLLAVRLMSQIKEQFQKNLPLATLFTSPTIEQLAHLLRSEANSLPWSALVRIKSNGNKPPLFCVHPAGGNVLCYQDLACYLSSEQAVYGLQSVGLDLQNPHHTSIEQMATHYIQEIQTVQPHGPYFLSGWSLGGLVAFEMAQQLQYRGEQIALLVLIDSCPPSIIPREPENNATALVEEFIGQDLDLEQDLDLGLEQLQQLETEEKLIFAVEQALKKHLIPEDFDLDQALYLLRIQRLNVQAIHNYQPQFYSGSIVLLKASETDADFESAWNELVESIETHLVPGNHQNMIKPPHVQILAQQLQKYLDLAQTD